MQGMGRTIRCWVAGAAGDSDFSPRHVLRLPQVKGDGEDGGGDMTGSGKTGAEELPGVLCLYLTWRQRVLRCRFSSLLASAPLLSSPPPISSSLLLPSPLNI